MGNKYLYPILLILIFIFAAGVCQAQWTPAGTLNVPEYNYAFLSATPSGDLLATTFHSGASDAPPRDLPALLIKNPTSSNPQVIELCSATFQTQRGYGGVACDEAGFFYLSADTGDTETCFLRKFRPDGSPDTSFGNGGIVKPGRRCLGLDVVGNYLLMAVDWGWVQVYNASSGQLAGSIEKPDEVIYVRDIAIDPSSMRVYGVAAGSVLVWDEGAPWEPSKYKLQRLTPEAGKFRAGEGISYDPINRAALITPVTGNIIYEVSGPNQVMKKTIPSAQTNTHLADSALSFDGNTLFITDIIARKIHLLKRSLTNDNMTIQPGQTASGSSEPSSPYVKSQQNSPPAPTRASQPSQRTGPAEQVNWHRSYTRVMESARRRGRPMVVYFRRKGVQKCVEFESNVLLTDEFNRRAQNFVCVFEDLIDRDRAMMAYRLGVFRVPHIMVLDKNGETIARFTYNISPMELFNALDSVR